MYTDVLKPMMIYKSLELPILTKFSVTRNHRFWSYGQVAVTKFTKTKILNFRILFENAGDAQKINGQKLYRYKHKYISVCG